MSQTLTQPMTRPFPTDRTRGKSISSAREPHHPQVNVGDVDKVNIDPVFGKELSLKMGQTHVHRYLPRLLKFVQDVAIDPAFVITHRACLEDGPRMYETFKNKRDDCLKVVMRP